MRNFILISLFLGLTMSSALAANCPGYNTLWENSAIRLNSGKYVWAKVSCDRNCFQVLLGSNDLDFVGNGTNCGAKIDEYWALNACGKHGNISGDTNKVMNEILGMCTR